MKLKLLTTVLLFFTGVTVFSQQYPVPSDAYISYRFNQDANSGYPEITNSVGAYNNLSKISGSNTYATIDRYGSQNALDFKTVNPMNLPSFTSQSFNVPVGSPATHKKTISFWFRLSNDAFDEQEILVVNNGDLKFRLIANTATRKEIYLQMTGNIVISGSSYSRSLTRAINDTQWHHVSIVHYKYGRQGVRFLFYVDGQRVGRPKDVAIWNFTQSNEMIFNRLNNYRGAVDDVLVYKRTLTPLEIKGLYNVCENCHPLDISVSNSSHGTVTITPSYSGTTATYASGTAVQLTAIPNTGYSFGSWSGDISGTNTATTFTIPNKSVAVTANFIQNPVYVNKSATGGANDGTSWANAYTDLQSALTATHAGKEVWVAKGIYTPTGPNGSRTVSFKPQNGQKIYGGFSGTESSLSQRNLSKIHTVNKTVLSGDLNSNDDNTAMFAGELTRQDNSYHILVANDKDGVSFELDGFSISGGNANGGVYPARQSAAYNNATGNNRHWEIIDNRMGGAVYYQAGKDNTTNKVSLNNCILENNTSNMYSVLGNNPFGAPQQNTIIAANFYNCIIRNNSAESWGTIRYFANNKKNQRAKGEIINTLIHDNEVRYFSNPSPNSAKVIELKETGYHGISVSTKLSFKMINSTLASNTSINNLTKADVSIKPVYNATDRSVFNQILFKNNLFADRTSVIEKIKAYYITTPLLRKMVVNCFIGYSNPTAGLFGDPLINPDFTLQPNSPAIDAGTNTITSITKDLAGNPRVINGVVDIGAYEYSPDAIAPTVTTQNATVTLAANGVGTLTTQQIDNGTTDNITPAASLVFGLDRSTFSCVDIGTHTVTLTASDTYGNASNATAIVTVVDALGPNVLTKNATVTLNASLLGTLATSAINNGTTDNCSQPASITYVLSKTNFSGCSDVGTQTVVLTATDAYGNVGTATAVVTVIESQAPIARTKNSIISLNFMGNASITAVQVNDNSSDSCTITSGLRYALDKTAFTCADLGANTVILKVTDFSGNSDTETAIVTVVDVMSPRVVAQDRTIYLNASGNGSITAQAIDNGSSDNCSIATMTINRTNFTCSDLGTHTVVLSVTDSSSNVGTATAVVTVKENVLPVALAKNATLTLNSNNQATLTVSDINNGSNDNCTPNANLGFRLSKTSFDCSDVGTQTVVLSVTDSSSNVGTATAVVTVKENPSNVLTARANNATVTLDANGGGVITVGQIDNGSGSGCNTSPVLSLSKMNFTCADLGSNTVVLTASIGGNSTSTTAIITVVDATIPTVFAQDRTIYLDASGNVSLTAQAIDNGSSDNCSIATMTINRTNFTCSDVGTHTVILSVTDSSSNVGTATAVVTVKENILPVALAKNATVTINGNTSVLATSSVNDNSTDNCGIVSYVVSPSSFGCSDVGTHTVTLTVTDGSGNMASDTAVVTVVNVATPTAVVQNATLSLNANGAATLQISDIDNGSGVSCGITPQLSLSKTAYTAADLGTQTVVLTVSDGVGNSTSATAVVTVVDNLAPIVVTQNVTISLNASGNASVTAQAINNGSSDNATVPSNLVLSLSSTTFGCSDVGNKTVILSVTDDSGNVGTATAVVTIEDRIAPIVVTQPLNITLGATNTASITPQQVDNGSSDNCSITSVVLDKTNFSCSDIGNNTVVLTVTDSSGNVGTATSVVTVSGNPSPQLLALARNITVSLGSNGAVSITPQQVDAGSGLGCNSTPTLTLSKFNFGCSNLGSNLVTLTATLGGNSTSTTAIVTVLDNVLPVAKTKDITVSLGANGQVGITAGQINNGSSDNCSVSNLSLDKTNFTCADLGRNRVTLTVKDGSGNESKKTAFVTVEDTTAPVVVTKPASVTLDANGVANISVSDVHDSSSDNCSVATITVSNTRFTCSDIGTTTVVVSATDVKGNVGTSTATVKVTDIIAPILEVKDVTLLLEESKGSVSLTTSDVVVNTSDNCGKVVTSLSTTTFTKEGTFVVNVTAKDSSGNNTIEPVTVVVKRDKDTVAPLVLTQSITVSLDAEGKAVVTPQDVDKGSSDNVDSVDKLTYSLDNTNFSCSDLGAQTVVLTVTDSSGNVGTNTAIVSVTDRLAPTLEVQDVTVDLQGKDLVSITDSSIVLNSSDNCSVPTIEFDQSSFKEAGSYTVTVIATDASGNVTKDMVVVTVVDNPITFTLTIDNPTNGTIYSNAASNVLVTGSVVTLTAVPDAGYDFVGWSGDITGKDNPKTITIDGDKRVNAIFKVQPVVLEIPKGFSPNADGINDTWVIKGNTTNVKLSLVLFNRSGRKVYSSEDYANDFAGIGDNGKKLVAGSYVYVLKYKDAKGNQQVKKAWVYINY